MSIAELTHVYDSLLTLLRQRGELVKIQATHLIQDNNSSLPWKKVIFDDMMGKFDEASYKIENKNGENEKKMEEEMAKK